MPDYYSAPTTYTQGIDTSGNNTWGSDDWMLDADQVSSAYDYSNAFGEWYERHAYEYDEWDEPGSDELDNALRDWKALMSTYGPELAELEGQMAELSPLTNVSFYRPAMDYMTGLTRKAGGRQLQTAKETMEGTQTAKTLAGSGWLDKTKEQAYDIFQEGVGKSVFDAYQWGLGQAGGVKDAFRSIKGQYNKLKRNLI